jgi:hypothetical protein
MAYEKETEEIKSMFWNLKKKIVIDCVQERKLDADLETFLIRFGEEAVDTWKQDNKERLIRYG